MAGDISIAVVPSSLQRVAAQIGGTGQYLNKFVRDMLYQEAALAANAFIQFNPPLPKGGGDGRSNKAKKQGELAVAKDVATFVMDKTKSTINTFAELQDDFQSFLDWKNRPNPPKQNHEITRKIWFDQDVNRAYAKMKNLVGKNGEKYRQMARPLDSKSSLRRVHDSLRRDFKGRIRNNGGPGLAVETRPFVADQKLIDSYIRDRQKAVGKMSSGWWNLILKIPKIRIRGIDANTGRKKVGSWIKRHQAPGLFIDDTGKGQIKPMSSVTIVNGIGDIFGVAREANVRQSVINFRRAQQARRPWQNVLDQAILTANKGQLPG